MATRKQRRRREKEQRHEYEVVYLDSEGNEVEPEEVEPRGDTKKGDTKKKAGSSGKSSRSTGGGRPSRARRGREPQPPSWQRAFRRAAIFMPLLVAFVLLTNRKHVTFAGLAIVALVFAVLMIPFTYFMDRMMWRIYQRRAGGAASKR